MDYPDLPESPPGGERTVDWIGRFTDEQLIAYESYLRHQIASAKDSEEPRSMYQSASYHRYRYAQWLALVDDEARRRV